MAICMAVVMVVVVAITMSAMMVIDEYKYG